MSMTRKSLCGKPYAGRPHGDASILSDDGTGASATTLRRTCPEAIRLGGTAVAAALVAAFAHGARVDLTGAKWIGRAGETELTWKMGDARKARGITAEKGHDLILTNPLPKNCLRLRRTFALPQKPVAEAWLTVTGLGFYEVWLNGRKIDPRRVLTPAISPHRFLADTYDVKALLTPGGDNTLGLWLSPGYSDDFSRFGWLWLAPKRALGALEVCYSDGTSVRIVTDGTWESTEDGPVVRTSLYHGELYDATRSDPDWARPSGSKADWKPVTVFPDGPAICEQESVPIRMGDPRRPVRVVESSAGVYTVDFGQNRAGVVRVRARGPRGTRIGVRTAEELDANGRIDQQTLNGAKSFDEFILAGTGKVEEFTPRFTYHGFRYAEITGWPGTLTADDGLEALAVHADVQDRLTFTCSHPILSWLHSAARWSMLSNLMSYPTDCAQRRERTACAMDSQTYEDVACTAFDMRLYYEKWMTDIPPPQGGNPDWTGQAVLLPFRLYDHYGEEKYLKEAIRRSRIYVDAQMKAHPDLLFRGGFGDWCAPNKGTWESFFNDVDVVNTAIFCDIVRRLADACAIAGMTDDAAVYRRAFESCVRAFNAAFFKSEDNTYGDGSQVNRVLPLAFGLVPAEKRPAVAQALVRRIRETDKCHIDTGIFGTRYIGEVLCDIGEEDLLMTMLAQPDYPGFGYMRSLGATTLWEQWQPRGCMHSHNHAMMSDATLWMYNRLAGIRSAKPGYAEILIKPCFPKTVDSVSVRQETVRGTVGVTWVRKAACVTMDVEIPKGVPAHLALPDGTTRPLAEGVSRQTFRLGGAQAE